MLNKPVRVQGGVNLQAVLSRPYKPLRLAGKDSTSIASVCSPIVRSAQARLNHARARSREANGGGFYEEPQVTAPTRTGD
jgi:hypothetical protein